MRKTVLALAGLCCTSWVLAQSASDAANAERMERAKRDASNPLRMIIEASSVKRAKPADAPPAAPAAARPPAEVAKAVAERKPAPRTEAPAAVAEAGARPVAAMAPGTEPAGRAAAEGSASAAAPEAAPPAAVPAAAGPSVDVPSSSANMPAAVPTAAVLAPATAAVPAAALAAPTAVAAPPPSQAAAEVLVPLKLARYIEPEIPARLRGRLKPTSEVTVAFKVRPDGSVSDVGIRQTTARALDPIVLDAVRQWRYDPVPAEREHVVQLVFNVTE